MNSNPFVEPQLSQNSGNQQNFRLQRKILDYNQEKEGPLLLFIAGMHGNEPAGVQALQNFAFFLKQQQPSIRGRIVGLIGNTKALMQKKRYLDVDFNRIWGCKGKNFQFYGPKHAAEYEEFVEIATFIETLLQQPWEEIIFVDLHTTSAPSVPFLLLGDTIRNRQFVEPMPLPKILGLEEQLKGPLLSVINEWGYISIGFEAGQ
ncbi:MAG: succinylglutamate desuccinylase/aspartoacylase family protein, partial [Bacteroidia bacterium]|nr:succinylglutamate desuccinylase/aspartoacylase family protein [Bacteroidia bacterium]MDW8157726.1 succinylglutamate desuccinylase/aspartoacylase family protein [Bacteroidia bacterium]